MIPAINNWAHSGMASSLKSSCIVLKLSCERFLLRIVLFLGRPHEPQALFFESLAGLDRGGELVETFFAFERRPSSLASLRVSRGAPRPR